MDVLDERLERAMRVQAEQVVVAGVDARGVRRRARRAQARVALLTASAVTVALAGVGVVAWSGRGHERGQVPATGPAEMYLPPVLTLAVPGGPTLELATQPSADATGLPHVVVCTTLGSNRWCPAGPMSPGMPERPERQAHLADVGQGTDLAFGWLHADVASVEVTLGSRRVDALVRSSAGLSLFAVPYADLGLTQDTALAEDWSARALDSSGRLVAQIDRPTLAGLASRHRPASPAVVLGSGAAAVSVWSDASGVICVAGKNGWRPGDGSRAAAAHWCGVVDPASVSVLPVVGAGEGAGSPRSLLLHLPPRAGDVRVDGRGLTIMGDWAVVDADTTPIAATDPVSVVEADGTTRTLGTVASLTATGTWAGMSQVVAWYPSGS